MPLFSYQRLLEETPIWGFWTWGLDKKPLIRLPRELLPKVQGHVCFKPKRTDDAQRKPEKLSLKKKGIGSEARGTRQQNYEQRVKIIVIKADPVTNQDDDEECKGFELQR